MSKLIIIPKDGKYDKQYLYKELTLSEKHIDLLNEYIINNNLLLDDDNSMYVQGVLMAMSGYCVVEIRKFNLDVYIPDKITKSQYTWFIENISEINKYTVSAFIPCNDDEILCIKKNSITDKNPIEKLYKKLDELVEVEKENDIRRSK